MLEGLDLEHSLLLAENPVLLQQFEDLDLYSRILLNVLIFEHGLQHDVLLCLSLQKSYDFFQDQDIGEMTSLFVLLVASMLIEHHSEELFLLAQFVCLMDMLGFHRKDGTFFGHIAPHSEDGAKVVVSSCVILQDFLLSDILSQIFEIPEGVEGQNDPLVEPVEVCDLRLCSHLFLMLHSILQCIISLFHQPPLIVAFRLILHLTVENCLDPVSQDGLLYSVALEIFQFLMHLVQITVLLESDKSWGKKLLGTVVICFSEIYYLWRLVVRNKRAQNLFL